MTEKKRKFRNLPTWLGIIAIIPIAVVMIEYWYLPVFFKDKSGLTREICWIVALTSGMLAGIAFMWNRNSIFKSMILGAITGLATGAASIWIAGGYLYLRGFPDSLVKFEMILMAAIIILVGIGISVLLGKLFGTSGKAEELP